MIYIVSVSVITNICVNASNRDRAIEKVKNLISEGKIELDYMSTSENTKYDILKVFEEDKNDQI